MRKFNRKGFTLIELLAVITIMGILMLVAIPAVSRTIENSRRDTFADVAKSYINAVRNSILADEFMCGEDTVAATGIGEYYFKIDSKNGESNDIMEQGGKSSWGNADVEGYVYWKKEAKGATANTQQNNNENNENNENNNNTQTNTSDDEVVIKTTYSIALVDTGKHGMVTAVEEKDISRARVKTNNSKFAFATDSNDQIGTPADATECTLK